jgi:carbon starvation protein CstA
MALIAACIIDPGLYYAMNAPAGLLGSTAQSASAAVANLGFTITPEQLTAAAAAVQEPSLIGRSGGAPTWRSACLRSSPAGAPLRPMRSDLRSQRLGDVGRGTR